MEDDEDFSDDDFTPDEESEDEDVNYEAAKDLVDSRWQGVTAACRR